MKTALVTIGLVLVIMLEAFTTPFVYEPFYIEYGAVLASNIDKDVIVVSNHHFVTRKECENWVGNANIELTKNILAKQFVKNIVTTDGENFILIKGQCFIPNSVKA